jgi:hypothetical protein
MAETTISELEDKQGEIEINLLVTKVDPIKTVVCKNGKTRQVAHCYVQDYKNNQGFLSLWDKEIPLAEVGSLLKVTNGYHWIYEKEGIQYHNFSSGFKGIVRRLDV